MLNRKFRFLTVIFFSFLSFHSQSQVSNHPYSFYGIGIPEEQFFVRNAGLGGLSVAEFNNNSINIINPASYSALEYTNFNIAFRGKFFNLHQDTISVNSNLFSFGYFSLGFPIHKKIGWSAAFGLLPVSRIGYTSSYSLTGGNDTIDRTEKFEFKGGFSKAFIGTSINLFKGFSFGANLFYLFGNTHVYHSLLILESAEYFGLISDRNSYYGNIGFNFGMNYHTKISEKLQLNIGAFYEPQTTININDDELVTTFLNKESSLKFKDTILKTSTIGGDFNIPLKYGFGLILSKTHKWQTGIDYKFEKWSVFTFPGISQQLTDLQEFSLGFEYTPNFEDISYAKRITYRTGLKYQNSYLNVPVDFSASTINYETLRKYGFSLGASFPIAKNTSFIDVAFEGGKIGTLHDDVIREMYLNVSVSFRFNDIWFIKPKYD